MLNGASAVVRLWQRVLQRAPYTERVSCGTRPASGKSNSDSCVSLIPDEWLRLSLAGCVACNLGNAESLRETEEVHRWQIHA
jgi:hypothetical protein